MKRAYGGRKALEALKHLGLSAIGEALETNYVVIEIDEPEKVTEEVLDEQQAYIANAEEYVKKHKVDRATWLAILEGISNHDQLPPNLKRIKEQYDKKH